MTNYFFYRASPPTELDLDTTVAKALNETSPSTTREACLNQAWEYSEADSVDVVEVKIVNVRRYKKTETKSHPYTQQLELFT